MKKTEYIENILNKLDLDAVDVDPEAVKKRVQAITILPDILKQLQSGTIYMKTYAYIPFFLSHLEYVAYSGELSEKTYKNTRMAIATALSILLDIAEVDEPQRDMIFTVWKQYFLSKLPQQDKKKVAKR